MYLGNHAGISHCQAATFEKKNRGFLHWPKSPACATLIRQQHAIQPGMDDAIAGAQGHAAAVRDELGQGAMSDHLGQSPYMERSTRFEPRQMP